MSKVLISALCVILVLCMLFTCACGGATEAPESSTPDEDSDYSDEQGNSGDESGTESDTSVPSVPVVNFGGQDFIFLARGEDAGDFATWDLEPNEHNSSQLNAALEQRNKYIEDNYGVTIKVIYTGGGVNNADLRKTIVRDQHAGVATYNAAFVPIYDGLELAGDGAFIDLNELHNININNPWWDINAMNSLSLANRYFFGVGDITVQIYETLPCIVFNKNMLKNYTDENLYELVETGKWTFDKLYSIAKNVSQDIDNVDGPSVGDYFGIAGQNDNMWVYFMSAGCSTVELNRYGEPELTIYNEQTEKVVDSIRMMMNDRSAYMNCNHYVATPGYVSSPIEFVIQGFCEQRVLFYFDGLLHLSDFANVDFDFGILPPPKYTEEQENYRCMIGAWGATACVIPMNCPDVNMTSLIIEAMAAKSKSTVSVEYYEKVLNIQSTRDEESENSLRIILNSKAFDMGICFKWGGLSDIVYNSVWNNNMTMASDYESMKSNIYADMNKTIQVYTDLPHYITTEG
ncbi:MAG: hypothetical protein IJK33_09115 [Clostridia bacterium]|nr:hypothetical protein [Clostridia bacterium]